MRTASHPIAHSRPRSSDQMRTLTEPFLGGALGALIFGLHPPVPGRAFLRPFYPIRPGHPLLVPGGPRLRLWRALGGACVGVGASLALRMERWMDWRVRALWTSEAY
jgi:hypothetical protein